MKLTIQNIFDHEPSVVSSVFFKGKVIKRRRLTQKFKKLRAQCEWENVFVGGKKSFFTLYVFVGVNLPHDGAISP